MNPRITISKSHVSTGLLLVMAAALIAGPSVSTAAPHSNDTSQAVQACVAEIGKRADYDNAARATHWVARLQQKNLAELSIEIETLVYADSDAALVRSYKIVCVTNLSHEIVKFRMAPTERGAA